MITITPPENLSPFDRPAIFTLTGDKADAGTTVDAVLEDADTGAILAARRIHLDHNAAAHFDAAPLLRRTMMLQPAAGVTGVAEASDCRFRVRMRAGGAQTPVTTLLCTAPQQNTLTLMSQMPVRRSIRYGESDTLVFYTPGNLTIRIEVQTGRLTQTFQHRWAGDPGLVALRMRTGDFSDAAYRIIVYANNSVAADYDVDPAAAEGVRVAWRNDAGIIEHYTFAAAARRTFAAEHRSVRLADGTCTVAATAHTELRLLSQYENRQVIDTLAAIAASPQVWIADEATGDYISVEVMSGEVVTHSFGEPSNVELTVRPSKDLSAL